MTETTARLRAALAHIHRVLEADRTARGVGVRPYYGRLLVALLLGLFVVGGVLYGIAIAPTCVDRWQTAVNECAVPAQTSWIHHR